VGRTVQELDFQRLLGQNYHTAQQSTTVPTADTDAP